MAIECINLDIFKTGIPGQMDTNKNQSSGVSIVLPDFQSIGVCAEGVTDRRLLATVMDIYWKSIANDENKQIDSVLMSPQAIVEAMSRYGRGVSSLRDSLSQEVSELNRKMSSTGWRLRNTVPSNKRKGNTGEYYFSWKEPLIKESQLINLPRTRLLVEDAERIKDERLKENILIFIRDEVLPLKKNEVSVEEGMNILALRLGIDSQAFKEEFLEQIVTELQMGVECEDGRVFSSLELTSLFGLFFYIKNSKQSKGQLLGLGLGLSDFIDEAKRIYTKNSKYATALAGVWYKTRCRLI